MYHNFFGLSEQAFSIAVNPRYLYMSDQHREALAHLLYGIQIGGFVMLTGEVGTGKTTIIRCLLEQMPANTDLAIILNPMASAPELLSTICDELGVRYIVDGWSTKDLTDALHHFLLENHRKGRKTVLLIDEAQLLKPTVLEQIRLLTNLETTTEKLLQIILVGQPELKKLLARPSLRQLSQRITARFHLEALSLPETHAYIAHRLRIAGMPDHRNPFPDPIIKRIHSFSGGIPRLINIICERMMLGAYGKNRTVIDNEIFEQAALEVSGTTAHLATQKRLPAVPEKWRYALAGVAGTIVLICLIWLLIPTSSNGPVNEAVAAVPVASSSVADSSAATASDAQTSSEEIISSVTASSAAAERVFWTRDEDRAHQALLAYLGADASASCAAAGEEGYACETTRVSTWNELRELNRPAVLTLVTTDRKLAYVLVIGLGEENALLLRDGAQLTVPWSRIAKLWNDELTYVWYRPAGFDTPLSSGQRGPAVNWLADQFARLDRQSSPLARNIYNDKLKKRVELFQESQGIKPDGIVGAQTLRRLNEVLGIDKALVTLEDRQSSASSRAESE
jgi:Type II secretory pathway, component ExeA (predicted ATPase)